MLTKSRRRRAANLTIVTVVLVVVVSACSDDGGSATTVTTADGSAAPELIGPLCPALPQGSNPGGPALLVAMPAAEALTWMPVNTMFEAGVRAAGMVEQLDTAEDITILAPSDDAFTDTFNTATLDDLLLFRKDEFGTLLEAHIVEGAMTLSELVEAGTVDTIGGGTITVTAAGDLARFDDKAEAVCGDYRVANATIHIIDGVLGELPEQLPEGDPDHE